MEMELTELKITKEDFEHHVPVAQSNNDGIFEACASFIESEGLDFCENVLGELGMEAVETNIGLRSSAIGAICNRGFVLAIRQLDVVLTNTGFGVVSTQDLTPASQSRVQAVEDNVRLNILRTTRNSVMFLRRVVGWGDTDAAQLCIPHICWSYREMLQRAGIEEKYSLWVSAQPAITEALRVITDNISIEMMSVLLDAERMALSLTVFNRTLKDCIMRAVAFKMCGNEEAFKAGVKDIVRLLEDNIDNFPEYRDSSTYEARHYKGYENRQDSKVYYF